MYHPVQVIFKPLLLKTTSRGNSIICHITLPTDFRYSLKSTARPGIELEFNSSERTGLLCILIGHDEPTLFLFCLLPSLHLLLPVTRQRWLQAIPMAEASSSKATTDSPARCCLPFHLLNLYRPLPPASPPCCNNRTVFGRVRLRQFPHHADFLHHPYSFTRGRTVRDSE